MICHGCQGAQAITHIVWGPDCRTQQGNFCRTCAKQMQSQFPGTTLTFSPTQEAA